MNLAFVPGFPPNGPRFLGRFLSPVAEGVPAAFARVVSQPGDIVLDPFGQSPSVAVEALSLNRRVIVAANNPILRLALSLALQPPAVADLKTALTLLGDVSVGPGAAARLEVQIKAMYQSTCAECQAPVTVDAFEWDAELNQPITKAYVCLHCGGPRTAPADADDKALARRFGRSGPDYYYLLSRTVAPDDTDRSQADDTLAIYPARSLAAIAAVLHKLGALDLEPAPRRLLDGLLVAAFDASTTLLQERPKVFSTARRYREVNLWLALEGGFALLAGSPAPDYQTTLDDLLARAGQPALYVHPGPMRDLAGKLPAGVGRLLLTAVPRPNQAFWTLSATWAGWLWGMEAVEAFRGSVQRRRYDWTWHARALHQTLAAAQPVLAGDGRLVALMAEAEPGFNASLLAAAAGAGYHLRGAALRAETAEAQLEFELGHPTQQSASGPNLSRAAREAAASALRARGEPSRWASLHFAAWSALTANRLLAWDGNEPLAEGNAALAQAAADTSALAHLSESAPDDPASGVWFLPPGALDPAGGRPLADRVEAEVVRLLGEGQPVEEYDLLREVYRLFPSALTPGQSLILACLASYAVRDESGRWRLRPEDALALRSAELPSIQGQLRALGDRSGFEVGVANPQDWREDGQTLYLFAVLTSAAISSYLLAAPHPARRRFLVLPGGRAGLVEHKLRRDPRLRRAFAEGAWSILKFRQVRRMMEDDSVTRATLEPALTGDPLDALQQLALPERGEE